APLRHEFAAPSYSSDSPLSARFFIRLFALDKGGRGRRRMVRSATGASLKQRSTEARVRSAILLLRQSPLSEVLHPSFRARQGRPWPPAHGEVCDGGVLQAGFACCTTSQRHPTPPTVPSQRGSSSVFSRSTRAAVAAGAW